MPKKEIDISEELLEAILQGEKIGPRDLNPKHAVDRCILEFCDWKHSEECDVPVTTLRELPSGKFLAIKRIKNMDKEIVTAIKWNWISRGIARVGFFDLNTGEYLRDAI